MWTTRDGLQLKLLRSDVPRVGRRFRRALARGSRRTGTGLGFMVPLGRLARRARYHGIARQLDCGCRHPVFAARFGRDDFRLVTRRLPGGAHAIVSVHLVVLG